MISLAAVVTGIAVVTLSPHVVAAAVWLLSRRPR